MSTKTKAGKGKSAEAKSEASFAPEPLPPVTPVPVGTDPGTLIFPEWSDQELNAEKWDIPKSKAGDKDKAKQKTPSSKKGSLTPGQFPNENPDEPLQFIDPHLVQLPYNVQGYEWKRPSEIFLKEKLIMFKEVSEYPDLISGSKHLLHSEFMRSFISAIGILEYLGNTRPSPIEFPSPTYVPNTNGVPWRPWHHIYSMCKAGKGQKHNPQVNQLGKYVVRLFWMGCWRRITIDDQLPIDQTNHVLFPSLDKPEPLSTPEGAAANLTTVSTTTETKDSKKKGGKGGKGGKGDKAKDSSTQKEIEIWPFLLCKALLKICNLTQTEYTEMLDFDIIHCLTGWFVQKIDVTGLDILDVWEMCAGYSDHFAWPDPTSNQTPATKKGSKGSKGSKPSKGSKGSKSTKSSGVPNFLDGDSGVIPYHLVATCSDMK